jgi:hypothetical protein
MSGMRGRAALRLVWTVTLAFGLWLTWYGVLRQSFAQLGHQTGFGEGGSAAGRLGVDGSWMTRRPSSLGGSSVCSLPQAL